MLEEGEGCILANALGCPALKRMWTDHFQPVEAEGSMGYVINVAFSTKSFEHLPLRHSEAP